MDEGQDDGLIERKLDVKPFGESWHFDVKTSSENESDMDKKAILVLYGDKGKSKEISLKPEGGKFGIDTVEKFDTMVEYFEDDIGELYKLIIGLGDSNESDENVIWKLNRIVAKKLKLPEDNGDQQVDQPEDESSKDNKENKDEGDKNQEEPEEEKPGKEDNQNDNKEEDSKKENEEKKEGDNENKDNNDKKDDKSYENETDKTAIPKEDKDDDIADDELLFKANKWIKSTSETDSWLEIPIFKKNSDDMLKILTYTIEIYTSEVENANTDAKVFIELRGERGDSHKRKLKKGKRKTGELS